MNKGLILLALFAIATIASAGRNEVLGNLWTAWKLKHKKAYTGAEEQHRFKTFIANIDTIARMNKEHKTAKFGINHFADLTSAEFKKNYTGSAHIERNVNQSEVFKPAAIKLPDSVDWRTKGAVTGVKNQGQCGSCWTFSATGAIEGHYFISSGKLVSFSEQQIVDCAHAAGQGCQGGWPYKAIDYVAQNGIETESDYPYTARDGSCKYNSGKAIKATSGHKMVTAHSSDLLKTALVSQPVSVCVQADQSAFQFYKSGVLATGCGASINHAVLAVGYGKVGVLEAFYVKNSWGTGWGNNGYIYLSTVQQINNGQGICGVLVQPVIAV